MKNLLEHYKTRIKFVENELINSKLPVSTAIKRKIQLECYSAFIKELERLIRK